MFSTNGEKNVINFVNSNEGLTPEKMSLALHRAFKVNYGHQYRVSINVWKAMDTDKTQGFAFNKDWAFLGLNKSGLLLRCFQTQK